MGAGAASAIGPIAGAVLGSVIAPGIGTALGTEIGAGTGATVGGMAGAGLGSAMANRPGAPPSAGTGAGASRGMVGGGQNYGGVPPPITGQQAGDIVSRIMAGTRAPDVGSSGSPSGMSLGDYAKKYPDLFKDWPSWMLQSGG